MSVRVAETALVDASAEIGEGSVVWHHAQIREGARIGPGCVLGKDVYVDRGVRVGARVKIQNAALVYEGVTLEDGVFVGPRVTFTNDLYPRAVNPDGSPKGESDWTVTPTRVREGASLGAACTLVCGVTVGRWALVAAGALVTRDVPDHGFVRGAPARLAGWVGEAGRPLRRLGPGRWRCPSTGREYALPDLDDAASGPAPDRALAGSEGASEGGPA